MTNLLTIRWRLKPTIPNLTDSDRDLEQEPPPPPAEPEPAPSDSREVTTPRSDLTRTIPLPHVRDVRPRLSSSDEPQSEPTMRQVSGDLPPAAAAGGGSSLAPPMPWPAPYMPLPAPTTAAPPSAPSADHLVTYYVDSSHNVQVTDDLLGAHKTPNLDDVYTAAQSEAAFEGVSRNFFIKKKRAEDEINIKNLPENQQKLFTGPKGSMWK